MHDLLMPYVSYLTTDCRYHPKTVSKYMNSMTSLMRKLDISNAYQLDANKAQQAWRMDRWQMTDQGIQAVEASDSSYAPALKTFVKYLKEVGFPVQDGVESTLEQVREEKIPLSGLLPAEQKQLREFLLFHISDDVERRDTALLFLLMTTGIPLEHALTLNVHTDGLIYSDRSSGHFEPAEDDCMIINYRGLQYTVPAEVVLFLNFYLENRKHQQCDKLFIRGNGRVNATKEMTIKAARKVLESLIEQAGIELRSDQISEVLRNTEYEDWSRRRITIVSRSSRTPATETFFYPQPAMPNKDAAAA